MQFIDPTEIEKIYDLPAGAQPHMDAVPGELNIKKVTISRTNAAGPVGPALTLTAPEGYYYASVNMTLVGNDTLVDTRFEQLID